MKEFDLHHYSLVRQCVTSPCANATCHKNVVVQKPHVTGHCTVYVIVHRVTLRARTGRGRCGRDVEERTRENYALVEGD